MQRDALLIPALTLIAAVAACKEERTRLEEIARLRCGADHQRLAQKVSRQPVWWTLGSAGAAALLFFAVVLFGQLLFAFNPSH